MFTFMLTKADFMGYCSCKLKFLFTIRTRKPTVFIIKSSEGRCHTLNIMDSLLPTPGTLTTMAVCLRDRLILLH